MTDRISALTVVLETSTRDDDVETLVAAIGQLRNVLSVTPHGDDHISHMTHMADERAKRGMAEVQYHLLRAINDVPAREIAAALRELQERHDR